MVEAARVNAFRRHYVNPREGRTLIVGSRIIEDDWRRRFPLGFGVDIVDGPGVDLLHDLERPLEGIAPFDHIECLSVLEHCRRVWLVAQNIEAAMAEDATIYVSAPFAWRWHGYPSDYWRFTHESLPVLFPRVHWEIIRYVGKEMHNPTKRVKGEIKPRVLPKCGDRHVERMEVHGFGVRR